MTPRSYAAGFDDRVSSFVPDAARRVPALAERVTGAGLEPGDLSDVAALDRLPVLAKDELATQQAQRPPFGGYLAPGARPRRIFASPGPIYEPEPDETDPWRFAPALLAAGFTHGDLVLNAFGYHLSPAGAMFEEACRAIGCTVVPGGVGNKEAQAAACADLGVTAYIGLPSYLKALLETRRLPLQKAFVTAEPLPPSLRDLLRERVPVVLQGYGTAEAGNLGYECTRMSGLHVPDDALVQVCDLTTGAALHDGEEGQVVATVFARDYPLVRFGTGDLSAWADGDCSCGLRTPRLKGWLGRVGDAVKVRGMFLHPRQIAALMAAVPGVAAYRFVIDRAEHRDTLRCELVAGDGVDPDALTAEVRERARSMLRFAVDVAAVAAVEGGPLVDLRTWG